MRLKQKLKSYFKTKQSSDTAVELLRMFILPFMAVWNPRASVDDAVMEFFGVEDRKFYHANAKKAFKMPGKVLMAGNRPVPRFGARDVVLGQYMLLAVDRADQTTRVDINMVGKDRTFLLTRAELEYIKDHIEVREV